jgi:endonuclease/exonuclease/phosphatase (EEP) superfamily protein YafD
MTQMFEMIRSHQGPLVVAGDFNTWWPARRKFLIEALDKLGLEHIHQSDGLLVLDHVFTRGLRTISHRDDEKIQSSDHKPMLLELEVLRNHLRDRCEREFCTEFR